MSIDPRFVIAPSLEMYFVDKDTGLPLSGGIVTFYSDVNRTTKKNVYTISGPPDYNYIPLPNPCILSSVGTFVDADGNDIIPYYYPFTGDPSTNTGVVELYYIVVTDSLGVEQFTRQAWPNIGPGGVPGSNDAFWNYIPNGQFLAHNNIPATATNPVGRIIPANAPYAIAQGGWYYTVPTSSTTVDTVTFNRIGAYSPNPTGDPRFDVEIKCTSPNLSDARKDLECRFPNVNKFASTTQQYTFAFTGNSNTGGSLTVEFILYKFFGTGGSSPIENQIATFTLQPTPQIFQVAYTFNTNEGQTIGANDDDYVSLIIRMPNTLFDVTFTDFLLVIGSQQILSFQDETNADMLGRSVSSYMPTPNPNGNDLYLPLVLTKQGMTFDHSIVGKIYSSASTEVSAGEVLCDGTQYLTSGYSSEGIPYSRLQAKLLASAGGLGIPIWGTGRNFVTVNLLTSSTNQLFLSNNLNGATTATSAGTIGFGVNTIFTGNYFGFSAYRSITDITNLVVAICDLFGVGPVTQATAGTSGFTIINYTGPSLLAKQVINIITIAASTLAGKYFTFSNTTTNYYMWFTVDGSGADPAPGGTGIKVDLFSTFSADDVAACVTAAMAGHQISRLHSIQSGGGITPGGYFTFTSVGPHSYYGWFTVNGVGTDPAPGGTGIKIEVLSTMTATQVTDQILGTINSYSFAVPDLRGMFLRGANLGSSVDPSNFRYTLTYDQNLGAITTVGSYEVCEFQNHKHDFVSTTPPLTGQGTVLNGAIGSSFAFVTAFVSGDITYQGGYETRPVNAAVNYVIKI